jgi:hypothetical protein
MPLDDVFARLKESRSALNIIVLDACRDDPFGSSKSMITSSGLAREDPPTGSDLVYATAPGGVAADGSGRNGLFTSHLLEEMEIPGPQIDELFHSVARRVDQDARRDYAMEQVPYRSFSYTGVFCLAGCDDSKIGEQAEILKQKKLTAAARIRELEQKNAEFSSESQLRDIRVQELEEAILKLRLKGSANQLDLQQKTELSRLEQALIVGKSKQVEIKAAQYAQGERNAEIKTLRSQLNEMVNKSEEIDSYRQRVAALEKENKDKERQITEGANKDVARRSKPTVVPSF